MQALNLLSSSNWEHLVITLLHTLWQGTLVGLVLLVSLRFLPASQANARYVVSLSALALTVIAGVFTFAILESAAPLSVTTVSNTPPDQYEIPAHEAAQPVSVPEPRAAIATPDTDSRASWNIAWKPVVAAVWLFGVSMMLLRIVVLVSGTSSLRRAKPVTDSAVLEMVDALRRQLGLSRSIRVVSTARISTPAVFGVLWPVLVLPASFASGVAPDQLRLILSHELAHIRRHDYLVNLVQMMIEAVLFFNPAIWWISRQVRTEREACADALAVKQTEFPDDYVAALAQWAEAGHHGALAQSFAGDARRGSLLERVRRLLIPQYQPTAKMPWLSLIAVFIVAAAVFAGMHWGGKKVVAVAVQMMSPKERVAAVVKVQQEAAPQLTENWPEKRTFSGTIETEDGGVITGEFLSYRIKLANGNGLGANATYHGNTFKIVFENGVTKLLLFAEGYVPAMLGPIEPGPSEHVSDIHVIFKRGFTGKIRFVDETGSPIPGVSNVHSFQFSSGNSFGWRNNQSTSGSDGIVEVKHVSSTTLFMLNIACPGYQQRRMDDFSFAPNKMHDIELKRAQPTTGIVVDMHDRPIVGAKVIATDSNIGGSEELLQGERGVLTNEKGRFTCDTLSDGPDYSLYVVSAGHGPIRLRKVRAGQTDLRIVLTGERRVRGTITGDLSLLPETRGTRRVRLVHAEHAFEGSVSSGNHTAVVEIDGNVGRFETPNYLPGILKIHLANETTEVELVDGSINDLKLVIRETTVQKVLKRPVVVRFRAVDDPHAVPNGTVKIQLSTNDKPTKYEFLELELVSGQVSFEAFMPGYVHCNDKSIPGYWFSQTSFDVAAALGDDGQLPLEVDVDLKPAGAITGRVFDSMGQPFTSDQNVSIGWMWPSGEEHIAHGERSIRSAYCKLGPHGRFFLSPVPLGVKMVIRAAIHSGTDNHMITVSKPIRVDGQHPTTNIDLAMPEGRMISGKVIDENGKPLAGIPVNIKLHYSGAQGRHGWSPPMRTDAKGSFSKGPFNPELGEYRLTILAHGDYAAATKTIKDFDKPVTIRLERQLPASH